jgi:CheY-like chemotaxis protein
MTLLTNSRALDNIFNEHQDKRTSMTSFEKAANAKTRSFDMEYDWSQYTILIAEDEDTNFIYLETALQRTNVNILRASNGKEAVEIAKVTPSLSLILMDMKMPQMNGLEATRSIKAFRKDIPIIAQTAFAMDEDRRNCSAVGCDDFLAKPIRYQVLHDTIAKYLK